MKKFGLFLVVAAAACAVDGCGDRSIEGLDASNVSVDASDDAFTVYGEVEPDESPPDNSKQEFNGEIPDNLDPVKVCSPYLGLWDCKCVDGICKGGGAYRLIELLSLNEYTMQFSVQIIGSSGGGFDIITCDPQHMPPRDAWLTSFYELQPDGKLKIEVPPENPTCGANCYMLLFCTISY